jgi:hypothetical protein
MSLELDAVGDYASRAGAAALGNSYAGSTLVWYRMGDSVAQREICSIARGLGTAFFLILNATTIQLWINAAARGTWTVSAGTWYGLALSTDETTDTARGRVFLENGSEVSPATGTGSYNPLGAGAQVSSVNLGNQNAYGDSASGQYRYWKYWAANLSQAEFAAEAAHIPTSGSPAVRTANLRGSWAVPDGTTTTDWSSGGAGAITINGGGTSAQEPTIGGGGASVFIPTQYRRTNSLLRM